MRKVLVGLALLLCLPLVGSGQSINYYPAGGGGGTEVALVAHDTTGWTTSTTSEELKYTITIPANTFPTNYKGLRVRVGWEHAANTNSAVLRLRINGIGGTAFGSRTSAVSSEKGGGESMLFVSGASDLQSSGWYVASTAGLGAFGGAELNSLTFGNAITVDITLTTGTSAGDMTINYVNAQLIK
jgi:hypothetical protein